MWDSGEKGFLGFGGRELRRWFWCGSDIIGAGFGAVCVSGGELVGSPGENGAGVSV